MSDTTETTETAELPEPGAEQEISMTFTREQWQRIYMAMRERRDDFDREREWETWKAHERIRLDMLERL